jgi:flagellar hook-associated protein 2
VGTGAEQETVSVVIPDGAYTAQNYVDAFNNASSKARASLINIGTASSPQYKIVISSTYEGTEKGQIARSALGASLTNLSAFSENAASDASLTITGIGTITRSTNSISDVIPGVTLSLSSTGTATVKISEDATSTVTKAQKFIDAYNEIVTFINESSKVTVEENGSEKSVSFGPLNSSRIDENALFALRSAVSSTVASSGSSVRIFADLGITTQRDGTLKLDTNKMQQAIATEPTSVSSVFQGFADTVALTGGTIDQYTRFNGLIDITTRSNQTTIDELNRRISDAEAAIQRQADALKARYARLESIMGKMQSQQQSLTSALSGLSKS